MSAAIRDSFPALRGFPHCAPQPVEVGRDRSFAPSFVRLGAYRMDYVASFFAGAFLCNCIPHLACGLRGETFPTPFARPRGRGPSAPIVNFLWGAFNFLIGIYLLARHPVAVGLEPDFIALVLGALALGIYLSLHFGKVRQENSAT
jgi:hypothetical protein